MDKGEKKVWPDLIKDYVDTGGPVGSRTIAKIYDLVVSPATIIHEMSDLEYMGFIHQPHTSAGRIPSDKGYRYYADCLMEPDEKILTDQEQRMVSKLFNDQISQLDNLFQQSCQLLSQLTNYTAMIMKPTVSRSQLVRLNLVRIGSNQLLAVMIGDDAKIHKKILTIPESLSEDDLLEMEQALQRKLQGLSVDQALTSIMQEITAYLIRRESLVQKR